MAIRKQLWFPWKIKKQKVKKKKKFNLKNKFNFFLKTSHFPSSTILYHLIHELIKPTATITYASPLQPPGATNHSTSAPITASHRARNLKPRRTRRQQKPLLSHPRTSLALRPVSPVNNIYRSHLHHFFFSPPISRYTIPPKTFKG